MNHSQDRSEQDNVVMEEELHDSGAPLLRQYLSVRLQKQELENHKQQLQQRMQLLAVAVQNELAHSNVPSVTLDGQRVRLVKRTNKEKLTNLHLAKCAGLYVLAKGMVQSNEQARLFASEFCQFVLGQLPTTETTSLEVVAEVLRPQLRATDQFAIELAKLDFQAILQAAAK